MIYINLIHLVHAFIRSMCVGDFNLYVECLSKIASFFFRLNHPNFSRYLVQYYSILRNLKETLPEVYDEYSSGFFSLKRTTKPFSGIPVDLTLEQTVNCDAALRTYGVVSLTNSIFGRQRWAKSHHVQDIWSCFSNKLHIWTTKVGKNSPCLHFKPA